MSQSDSNPLTDDSTSDSSGAGAQLNRLVRLGRSFSARERNCCFLNLGEGRFIDISAPSGVDFPEDGRGLAVVDWDGDGDLDLWVSNRTAPQVRFLRNDVSQPGQFLAFRLVGTQCNRDAIGARVVLRASAPTSRPLTKTLRAGDGYLSQSSKWLHFGLGDKNGPYTAIVTWPGGQEQRLVGLRPNSRYEIIQGENLPRLVSNDRTQTALSPTELLPRDASRVARVRLSTPFFLPPLSYDGAEGATTAIAPRTGRPLLVNLWASWCSPCVAELASLTAQRREIEAVGLDVLALSVDSVSERISLSANGGREARGSAATQLDPNEKGRLSQNQDGGGSRESTAGLTAPVRAEPSRLLEQMQFPFSSGVATERLLIKLQLIHDEIFARYETLPLPCSFLIDGRGRLVGIYKGPAQVSDILQDVADLKLPEPTRRAQAYPFPGRWYHRQMHHWPVLLAKRLVEEGYINDAIELLSDPELPREGLGESHAMMSLATRLFDKGQRNEGLQLLRKVAELHPDNGDVQYNLGLMCELLGDREQAIAAFSHAIRAQPQMAKAHYHLGVAHQEEGDMDLAIEHWQRAVNVRPDYVDAQFNLGLAWKQQGQPKRAIPHLRKSVELNPRSAGAYFLLAESLESVGQPVEAVELYRHVVKLAPEDFRTAMRLAWLLATHPDEQLRNGVEAVELARRVCTQTEYGVPTAIDVLAAAYAETGDFDRAARLAEQALELGRSSLGDRWAEGVKKRLNGFQNGQACTHPCRS